MDAGVSCVLRQIRSAGNLFKFNFDFPLGIPAPLQAVRNLGVEKMAWIETATGALRISNADVEARMQQWVSNRGRIAEQNDQGSMSDHELCRRYVPFELDRYSVPDAMLLF